MTCREYRDLMMAYLDEELDEHQRKAFEGHLASCRECSEELAQFQRLKTLTDSVPFAECEDRIWEQYWGNVYNRVERGLGWMIFSIAAIGLVAFAGWKAIETIIQDPAVSLFLKVLLLALTAGVAILFVSVLRERLFFWKRERYKDVRR
jgi:hypothetical protein